jgi:hypothetical protein
MIVICDHKLHIFDKGLLGMTSRVPAINPELIHDFELKQIPNRAERLSTPKPAWYLTLAHNPEMAKAYAAYWDITHRGGRVEPYHQRVNADRHRAAFGLLVLRRSTLRSRFATGSR